ncbi:hypothetical protein RF11_04493 [Thelohanellus kitauei]|uniref:Uncharacterized protein n=1 Tax=Thelohanellus kitauei TaxID=669202 RepID=A0A0C2MVM9_THEKT|nr:hypothetical protein RF11_04493 [Thelohanellus kitauei]
MDKCKLRKFDGFFSFERFLDYVKNQGIPKENYTNMMISAQCNRQKAIDEFFSAYTVYQNKLRGLLTYLVGYRESAKGKIEPTALMENVKNNPLYSEWTSNRFLTTILDCYLQGDHLDMIVSLPAVQQESPSTPNTSNIATLLLIVGGIGFAVFVVGMILCKHGILIGSKIRVQGDGVYFDIRENVIAEA